MYYVQNYCLALGPACKGAGRRRDGFSMLLSNVMESMPRPYFDEDTQETTSQDLSGLPYHVLPFLFAELDLCLRPSHIT